MRDLEAKTRYEPSEVEPRIVQEWLQSGLFHPEPAGDASENYCRYASLPSSCGHHFCGRLFGCVL